MLQVEVARPGVFFVEGFFFFKKHSTCFKKRKLQTNIPINIDAKILSKLKFLFLVEEVVVVW